MIAMKKLAVALLVGLALTSNGCVTYMTHDAIQRNVHTDEGRAVATIATAPLTVAADVALAPVEVIAAPLYVASHLGGSLGGSAR